MEIKNESVILSIETYDYLKVKIDNAERTCARLEMEYDKLLNEINNIKSQLCIEFIEKNKILIELYFNKDNIITEKTINELNDNNTLKDNINKFINKYNIITLSRLASEIDLSFHKETYTLENFETLEEYINDEELPFADIEAIDYE